MAKTNATILIIDDDEDVLLSAKLLLKKRYTNIIIRTNPKEINKIMSTETIDVFVLAMINRIDIITVSNTHLILPTILI